ncbi:hypothetical protein [Candidatus Tisiphia endosymbiont of Micropterix aruncella]|uniref:hypothetical protein n=1 Tax=Candidatus Tisiphia endosymbiont of Micropterix aruncella TaxID=3066271 RepID=UPI003AA979FE
MDKKPTTAYKQHSHIKQDKRSKDELYESIVNGIRAEYNGKLSDVEAHTAARNLIEFVKILLHFNQK